MVTRLAPDEWNLANRVPKAARYLSGLPEDDLIHVIRDRLEGGQNSYLPRFERYEQPADLFVDVTLNLTK